VRAPRAVTVMLFIAAVSTQMGCGTASQTGSPKSASAVIHVVAAENFWGSIAGQLGGNRVTVTNIVNNPSADPHDYEATVADARAIATADIVVINGAGYDAWATKLAEANPRPTRTDLTVADVVGVVDGENPHRWYNPKDVRQFIDRIVAEYQRIDPSGATYFLTQKNSFEKIALAEYSSVITDIAKKYGGTPVGASESIFSMIAPAIKLNVITPPSFLKAISEGIDPTAGDKSAIDEQLATKAIKVYVYNPQNAGPDVQRQIDAAKSRDIPVITMTETMPTDTTSWQQWQTAQLMALRDALAQATGR
jgi:zinc/manganese transport system substrate-binding protein